MSATIKFATSKQADTQVRINLLPEEQGKQGIPAYLNEGNNPGHRVRLFKKQAGDNSWFEISGPIRKVNEDGSFATYPRKNDTGDFLNEKGQVVNDETSAARQFEYIKNKQDQVVMGVLGSLNIKNTKRDGTPTKMTFASLNLHGDDEVLKIERKVAEAKHHGGDKAKEIYQEVKAMRKASSHWHNLFIQSGSEVLQGMGFEIRPAA